MVAPSTRFPAPRVYQLVKAAPGFPRLAWSNLAAQSAEQIGLAATPLVAVLALGAGAGETGFLQTAQTLPFLILAIPAGCSPIACRAVASWPWPRRCARAR